MRRSWALAVCVSYLLFTTLAAMAALLGWLFHRKYRPRGLDKLCGFQAALGLMGLRFSALWVAELTGIETPNGLAEFIYLPALWLFASQGPLFALSLGRKAPPVGIVHAVKAGALTACLLSLYSAVSLLPSLPPAPQFVSILQDLIGLWIPGAFMCAWGIGHGKESLAGPFRPQLIAFLALSAALMAALALSMLGLVPESASPFIFSGYGIILNAAFIAVGTSWFLSPPQRTGGLSDLLIQARGISPREAEVAALILQGMSSRDIARTLFISPRTVESHIARVYRKTGTSSRFGLLALSGAGDPLRNPTQSQARGENT